MKRPPLHFCVGILLILSVCCTPSKNQVDPSASPNILIIYADDLGYGDVGAYGSVHLKTPNLDRLAQGGLRFLQGYAASATCTPSRYALLTGRYPWKNQSARILPGSAPLIIDTAAQTLPKMLQNAGYETGIVGKWHLGLGRGEVDWNKEVRPGPNEVGFDYAFILAATQDRTPTVYLRDGKVVGLDPKDPLEVSYVENFAGEPTGLDNPELLKLKWHHGHNNSIHNGIPRIGFQKGGKAAMWVDEDMADEFLEEAQSFVKVERDKPFFLYYSLQQPHVPRTPHARFVGSSGMGPRGDAIVELDWCVGEIFKTLEEEGVLDQTLILFSSDNGPVLNDGYYDDAVELLGEHTPFGPFRGGKYSLYEAGTRVPFLVHWPEKIKPGTSNALISQLDIFSSLAQLVSSDWRGEDSEPLLDVLLGKSEAGREELILEATGRTAFRKGAYVMIPPYPGNAKIHTVNIEIGNSPEYQLFHLQNDLAQQTNLEESEPQRLMEMKARYEKIISKSRH